MALLESTQTLLADRLKRGYTLREIALGSEGDVELQWLYRFSRGEIDNPGVKSVESLHERLKALKPKAASAA